MSLSDKQFRFARKMAALELWIAARWKYVRGEALRSGPEATRLAAAGLGIANSVHRLKLAQDLLVFDRDGNWQNPKIYKRIADKWLSMDEDARAGYYFKRTGTSKGRDVFHFSFIHNGVQ